MRSNEPDEVPAAAAFHPDARTKEMCLRYEAALAELLEEEVRRVPELDGASLLEVAPHPDATSILVVVVASSHEAVLDALEAARARLQRELGSRTGGEGPELTFAVTPPADLSS